MKTLLSSLFLALPLLAACQSADKPATAAPSSAQSPAPAVQPQQEGWVCPMGPSCSGVHPEGGACPKCGMKMLPMSEYTKTQK